jgi:hypothetical protein
MPTEGNLKVHDHMHVMTSLAFPACTCACFSNKKKEFEELEIVTAPMAITRIMSAPNLYVHCLPKLKLEFGRSTQCKKKN